MNTLDPSYSAPKITVIGTGYLGATHAICMAVMGFDVLGFDVDHHKIDQLRAGKVPFFEPGLPEKLQEALATGRLKFSTSLDEVADFGDVHFICVGTPQAPNSSAADMTYVESAFTGLAARVTRKALLVGKSTVPIGTAERLTGLVAGISSLGTELEVAWNPEFLREGFAVQDTLHPDRLVFGVASAWAEDMLRHAFRPLLDDGTPLIVADLATSELVKVAANSFLATKISFINAMAEVCEATSADVSLLAAALSLDDRIGSRAASRTARRDSSDASTSATSTPAATGAGPRTTSTRWCAPPGTTYPATTSSPRVGHTACVSSWPRPSSAPE